MNVTKEHTGILDVTKELPNMFAINFLISVKPGMP